MSYHILSETENSFERTMVYQTMHENFVVIVQQNRLNEKEDWTTKNHCMIPKIFVNFIAQLSDKPQSTSGGFITSGGHPLKANSRSRARIKREGCPGLV